MQTQTLDAQVECLRGTQTLDTVCLQEAADGAGRAGPDEVWAPVGLLRELVLVVVVGPARAAQLGAAPSGA